MSFSNFLENKLLDHVWSNTAMTVSGTLYVGLATASMSDTTTGITVTEPSVSATAYARVSVTNNLTNWPAAANGTKQNGTAINFPTATGNWGTVTDFFIADNVYNTGQIMGWGVLTTSKTISSGDTASFAISAITITLD